MKPLCFVLMPFGTKPVSGGIPIRFDAVYNELIAPAIRQASLEPLRADEEQTGGMIHQAMFERLILSEYAVADLTTANANVFYELGLRHAVRPASTVLIFAEDSGQLPFDVDTLRAVPYRLGTDGKPANTDDDRMKIFRRLEEAPHQPTDSSVYQLVAGFPDIQRLKTDVFRERVTYSEQLRAKLALARKQGRDAVHEVEKEIDDVANAEAGIVIDLFLSYRAVKSWADMIELVPKMAPPLAATVMVREQLGLALNRANRGDEGERVLLDLLSQRGPSSETYGILGRVYKDRWEAASRIGENALARGLLTKAIDAYLKGFEADWRDAYPGINAVTLMELCNPPDERRLRLIPVVAYAAERRIATGRPDYWDYATRLELAVLANDQATADDALANALAAVREVWEPETTARNLHLIIEARQQRGQSVGWAMDAERSLQARVSKRG